MSWLFVQVWKYFHTPCIRSTCPFSFYCTKIHDLLCRFGNNFTCHALGVQTIKFCPASRDGIKSHHLISLLRDLASKQSLSNDTVVQNSSRIGSTIWQYTIKVSQETQAVLHSKLLSHNFHKSWTQLLVLENARRYCLRFNTSKSKRIKFFQVMH